MLYEVITGMRDLGGQDSFRDRPSLGEQHGALDDVEELAYVARPRVLLEHLQGLRREPLHALAELRIEALDERGGEEGNVRGTVSERRELDGEHPEPVEEIGAETTPRDLLLEPAIRGGHDTSYNFV